MTHFRLEKLPFLGYFFYKINNSQTQIPNYLINVINSRMHLLLAQPNILDESEYTDLKTRQKKMISDLEKLQEDLAEINKNLATQSFFHEPNVILSIMKNEKHGDKWLGRLKVPENLFIYFENPQRNRFYMSFVVCNASEYSDKSDPELQRRALEEAKKTLKKRFLY